MKGFFIEDKFNSCINELNRVSMNYISPEFINEFRETAPSKRIIKLIGEYDDSKPVADPQIVKKIGIDNILENVLILIAGLESF